jgi:hypothetical protein
LTKWLPRVKRKRKKKVDEGRKKRMDVIERWIKDGWRQWMDGRILLGKGGFCECE